MKIKNTVTTDSANAVSNTTDTSQNRSVISNAMKIKSILMFMAFCVKGYAQVSLPYSTDFESQEGFVDEAPLSVEWAITDTSIVVSDDTAQSGAQSVRITPATPENIISLNFDPSENNILFLDYHVKLTPSDLPDLPPAGIARHSYPGSSPEPKDRHAVVGIWSHHEITLRFPCSLDLSFLCRRMDFHVRRENPQGLEGEPGEPPDLLGRGRGD